MTRLVSFAPVTMGVGGGTVGPDYARSHRAIGDQIPNVPARSVRQYA